MKNVLASILLSVCLFNAFSQSPEWVEFSRLRDTLLQNDIAPEVAYSMYYKMDSIYNGIPYFGDIFNYLGCAIKCEKQDKMKELAFRVVRWKCWDRNFFDKPEMTPLKETEFWPKLDSLSQINGSKEQIYKAWLEELLSRDQNCRKALHGEHSESEMDSIWAAIHQIDSSNFAKLNELISQYGFPTWENVGDAYATYAFLIAQHSEPNYLHWYVEQYKEEVIKGNLGKKPLAYLIDRDRMNQNLPQLYGTQSTIIYSDDMHGETGLWPVEDMEHLNDRREHMLLAPLDTTGLKIFELKDVVR